MTAAVVASTVAANIVNNVNNNNNNNNNNDNNDNQVLEFVFYSSLDLISETLFLFGERVIFISFILHSLRLNFKTIIQHFIYQ